MVALIAETQGLGHGELRTLLHLSEDVTLFCKVCIASEVMRITMLTLFSRPCLKGLLILL